MTRHWAKRRHLYKWRPASAAGLDPVSSHSPSAPLVLSKRHNNPTNPAASHHDCLRSGSPARHIRTWNEAGGAPPPITISEKDDSLLSVCLFLVTAGKYIIGLAAGAEGAGVGVVGGNSVTSRAWKKLFLLAHGGLFILLSFTDGFL